MCMSARVNPPPPFSLYLVWASWVSVAAESLESKCYAGKRCSGLDAGRIPGTHGGSSCTAGVEVSRFPIEEQALREWYVRLRVNTLGPCSGDQMLA